MIGEAAGDCLKAVYELHTGGGRATTSALASGLRVSMPTVTAMLKRLAKQGLLFYSPYRGAELTQEGEVLALEILRHHRLLELYLVRVLGMDWGAVHGEADRLEHYISGELADRMEVALEYPAVDPHGHPIPTKQGLIDTTSYPRLSDLEPGEGASIHSVPDHDPRLLDYLAQLGLLPNSRVDLVERAPFRGPLTLRVGETQHAISIELAQQILVFR